MKVIVFGGSGMLGSTVVRHLADCNFDVSFTINKRMPTWFPLEKQIGIQRFDAFGPIPDLTKFDYAINCIGAIKQKQCTPFEYYALNSVFPWRLAEACKASGVKLIHISSDCVFSGKSPDPIPADSQMDAEDDYGRSKALGEPKNAIVLRTSIIGPSDDTHGLFEWLRNSTTVDGYENHRWSGVTTHHLALLIERILKDDFSVPPQGGLIQVASQWVQKYELLQFIKQTFELDVVIKPVRTPEDVNRILIPSLGYEQHIRHQLSAMKHWMKKHGIR